MATIAQVPRSTCQIVIDRPTEEVFAFVSDPTHDPQWHDTVLEVRPTSEPPLRDGSTFTAVFRSQGSSETHDLVGEMAVYEPGRRSELRVSFTEPRGRVPAMIGRFVLTFQVEPEGSGTRLTRGVETRGAARRYRLLWLLLGPLSGRSNRARQDELLGRIKTILESGTAVEPAS
jgi:uncharacterized protein YndB with AHSA1/START domain